MAESTRSTLYRVPIGAINYAFKAPKDAYKNIDTFLGVAVAKDTDDNLVFGAQKPRPVRLRISYQITKDRNGSVIRFCSPDKVKDLLLKNELNKKKILIRGKEYEINGANILGARK